MKPVQLCDTMRSCVYVLVENLASSSLPARVSDKRLKRSIKLLSLCKDAVTINIYSLAVIVLVKTMCRPVGPFHFGHHHFARRRQKSVFDVHMISVVALPNVSSLEVFTGSDLGCAPSPDGPQCKQRDSGQADVGSALMWRNRKSDNTYTCRSSLASESSCFFIRR